MSSDPAALVAADAAARLAAQRELVRPFVLEAGAGTGKTAALVARVLAWSLGQGWAKAEAALGERAAEPGRGPGAAGKEADPEAVAARVLDRLTAITFTEAAAAEMAEKVAAAFGEVLAGKAPPGFTPEALEPDRPEQARRARALLAQLDRLNVSTIHAFCRRLLAAHPLAAGLHPDFEVDAEGEVLDEVLREMLDERLREAYAAGATSSYLDLAAAGVGPRELAEAARELVLSGVPQAELERDAFPPELAADLVAGVRRAAEGFLAVAAERLRTVKRRGQQRSVTHDVLDGVERLAALALRPAASAAHALDAATTEACAALDGDCCERLSKWAAAELNQGESGAMGDGAPALAAAAHELDHRLVRFTALQPLRFEAARRALVPLVAEVHARLRERGAIHYQALLTEARELLSRHAEVLALVRRGLDQLLVDEFQDTDHVQCDLIRLLALSNPADEWGPADERPGLFLVGDPKQSIYGWRSADLAAYDGFVAEVLAAGGVRERLSVNFRSVPAILAEVERLIEPVMEREEGVQPAFQPLAASEKRRHEPGFSAGGRAPVEHWISWSAEGERGGAATPARKAAEIEAAAIARDLRSLHDDHGTPWDAAAILLRTTTDLDVYLRALQEAGIPYAVARDRSYFRRREVLDAGALVRAVLDPADHLALVACLRAPWVGVPDAALPRLWREGLPQLATDLEAGHQEAFAAIEAMAARVGAEVAALAGEIPGLAELAGWERSLVAFLETLAMLRASFAADPADVFVDKLRASTLIEATEAARFLGPWRLANLERFFRQLAERLDEGGDVQAVPRFLRQAVTDSRQAPEGRPRAGGSGAVAVATIHKAKGLDFQHVYVPQLHKRPRSTAAATTAARELPGERRWELLLLSAPSPGFWRVKEHDDRVRAAEQVRLLYVATTRAEDRLVLLGSPPRARANAAPPSPLDANCFAELLALRNPPPPDAEEAFARLQAEGRGSEVDGDGVRWAFPDLQSRSEGESTTGVREGQRERDAAASPALPSPAEIAADRAELERLLAAAAARQSRPFSAAVSAEAHEELEALFASAGDEGDGGEAGLAAGARSTAQAVGSAVHRLLESFAPDGDPEAALAQAMEAATAGLARGLTAVEAEEARERLASIVERFRAGPLWPRFLALQEAIVARELPVLLPAPAASPTSEAGPVAFLAGAADLVYLDAENSELVVVDYKTDELSGDDALAERAAAYRSQGEGYRRAVQEALGLLYLPRFELWFLAVGEVWGD